MDRKIQFQEPARAAAPKRSRWLLVHVLLRCLAVLASAATIGISVYGAIQYDAASSFTGALVAVSFYFFLSLSFASLRILLQNFLWK